MTRNAHFAAALVLALPSYATGAIEAQTLSSRPDMVTGGDTIVQINGASGQLEVRLNGEDVSDRFRPTGGGLIGKVDGLKLGKNVLKAKSQDGSTRLELTNYPRVGPVFSGPHQQPFVCVTERFGLGEPLDEDCSIKTRVEYFYKSSEPLPRGTRNDRQAIIPQQFKRFDASAPRPADIAQTTTSTGKTVDFIVRVETGTINRAIYQIAFLHGPGSALPEPWSDAPGNWNGRLVYTFGGGCRAGYHQGRSRSVLSAAGPLGRGFAVAASSLNVFGNNCNDVLSAETMMMVKEHFVESFGMPVHTIGFGGSGGSMQQHLIAQNYPGLLDGIIPGASYPDILTIMGPVSDCSLLAAAFEKSAQTWTDEQKTAVSGYATWKTCESWMRTYSPSLLQPDQCNAAVPKASVYDPTTNPSGTRCGVHDNQVNLLGRDPVTGFADRPLDNVGVQYGLKAYEAGSITAEQFVELNENVGGYDADGNIVGRRSVAGHKVLEAVYSKGRVNSGAGSLGSIPIIDTRRYQDPSGNIHDRFRTFSTEARLEATNGTSANRVVLTNTTEVDPIGLMSEWLDNIAADSADGTIVERIARNKPKTLEDSCQLEDGTVVAEDATYDGAGRCNGAYPSSGDPRLAAGAPLANDVLKCSLKPMDASEYSHPLSAAQFERLRAVFPDGVCDFSRPGIGQVPLIGTWLTYSSAAER